MSNFKSLYPDDNFFTKKKSIVDIRTNKECMTTGIIDSSLVVTFFNELGEYKLEEFIKQLNRLVDKNKQFVLVCRIGKKSKMIGKMLSEKYGYDIISLDGGIQFINDNLESVKLVPYNDPAK